MFLRAVAPCARSSRSQFIASAFLGLVQGPVRGPNERLRRFAMLRDRRARAGRLSAPRWSCGQGRIRAWRLRVAVAMCAEAGRRQLRRSCRRHASQIKSQNNGLPEKKAPRASRRSAKEDRQPVGFEREFCYTWHPRIRGNGRWAVRPFFVCRADSPWI